MTVADRTIIEAILMVVEEPVPVSHLAQVLEKPQHAVAELLADMASSFEAERRGFVLRQAGAGWRLYTSPECAPWLERFVLRNVTNRLTPAALEVLACTPPSAGRSRSSP